MTQEEGIVNPAPINPVSNEVAYRYIDKDTEQKEGAYKLIPHTKIRMGWSKVASIGIFTTGLILEKEIIERCPLEPLMWRAKYIGDGAIYRNTFVSPLCPCEDCKRDGNQLFVMLGYGTIYNHQPEPYANAVMNFNKEHSYLDIVAIKDIKPDSEIFLDYGQNFKPMSLNGDNQIVLIKDE